MHLNDKLSFIILNLIGSDKLKGLAQLDISGQYKPKDNSSEAMARNLNAAFLISLIGKKHPSYQDAIEYLQKNSENSDYQAAVDFFLEGLKLIPAEINEIAGKDFQFFKRLDELFLWFKELENNDKKQESIEKVRQVFFPEGVGLNFDREKKIQEFRQKRNINISKLNPKPINNPAQEVLFTANALLTIPAEETEINSLSVKPEFKEKLKEIIQEAQHYWYDHPIQIGVENDKNEVIYGLKGLAETLKFEKKRGNADKIAILNCLLSVSVTHQGLKSIAREYLQEEIKKAKGIDCLYVFIFTEEDTQKLIDEVFVPAARQYLPNLNMDVLSEVFGVDGEYSRHYSFLKAIAALWQVLINPEIKATFKIDLDQVFPQQQLVDECGYSVFEHLKSPLWGAVGIDDHQEMVKLGMIAGTLVNEKDINKSIYTPDVDFPPEIAIADEVIFSSWLCSSISTRAEMMTKYNKSDFDGEKTCVQRVHVTGGTNGILVESLRKYRPFTPTFIGRAEDQAYILASLYKFPEGNIRYVHKDGLVMRHDKKAFAGQAIEAAKIGSMIGDYIRILVFSKYADALPWPAEKTKELVDPFTGCFISKIPLFIVYLRFAFKVASFFAEGNIQDGFDFFKNGTVRLNQMIKKLHSEPGFITRQYQKEKEGWDIYYDILDKLEKNLAKNDQYSIELQEKAKQIINNCMLTID